MAVVMLTDFGEENLPQARSSDQYEGYDLATWNEIHSAAKDLIGECVERLRATGWIAVGKEDALNPQPTSLEVKTILTSAIRLCRIES